MSEHIKVERDGPVTRVGFDRPEKRNALTIEMYDAVIAALEEFDRDDEALALVMHGSDTTYTSGNDLMGFMAANQEEWTAETEEPSSLRLMKAMERAEKPVIAAVEGWCVGIGATLLLHTDLVYMGEGAKLKMPFTELGIVPEAGASLLLTRRFGRQAAGELLIASDVMSARRAYELGLCNEVVADGGALDRAMTAARRVAEMSPTSVRMTKRLMREADGLIPHMEEEMRQVGERVRSDEMKARVMKLMTGKG